METGRLAGPARVLVMVEQSLIADVIELTLNHGVYVTRKAKDLAEATVALEDCGKGNTAASIPVLEKKLRESGFSLPEEFKP